MHYKNNSPATTEFVRAIQSGPIGHQRIPVQLCIFLKEIFANGYPGRHELNDLHVHTAYDEI